jgi:hypothetical protein
MADAEPSPAAKNPASLVFGVIAPFLAIFGCCAADFLWPRGERLGASDLRSDTPTLSVDVGPGDKPSFRIDTITGGTTGDPRGETGKSGEVRSAPLYSIDDWL